MVTTPQPPEPSEAELHDLGPVGFVIAALGHVRAETGTYPALSSLTVALITESLLAQGVKFPGMSIIGGVGTATPADPDGVQHELDDLTAWAHEVCEAAGVDVAEEGWDEKAVEAIRAARTPERPRAASGHIVPGDWRYYRLAEIAHAALFYEDDEDGPIFRWSDRRLASDDDGLLKCAADATAGAVWNNRAEIIALLAAPTPGEPSPSVAAPPLRGDPRRTSSDHRGRTLRCLTPPLLLMSNAGENSWPSCHVTDVAGCPTGDADATPACLHQPLRWRSRARVLRVLTLDERRAAYASISDTITEVVAERRDGAA